MKPILDNFSGISGRPQRKSSVASTALAASRRSGVLPPSIPKIVPSIPKIEGNSERTTSRRNTSRQSHVITPSTGSIEVNGKPQNGKRDGSQSRERRDFAIKSETMVSSNGLSRNLSPKTIPKAMEGRKSPSTMSSESKFAAEESLMPPPRLLRRRSPRRLHSPDQISSNTIDVSSGKSRKELPASEPKRPGDGLSKTRQSAPARSPVAETVSKPSTSAASNKRRSGVVKEVEKMQVSLYNLIAMLHTLSPFPFGHLLKC